MHDKVRYFVAGSTLEPFVSRTTSKGRQHFGGVTTAPTSERAAAYLKEVESQLLRGNATNTVSPFERFDREARCTFVDEHLSSEVLGALSTWNARVAVSQIEIFGTVNLATTDPTRFDGQNAFRCDPGGGEGELQLEPILSVRMHVQKRQIAVSSHAEVWLRASMALGGLVAEAAADENLLRLGAFIVRISGRAELDLHLEGAIFSNESARIRGAIIGRDTR